jgi:hypothetical protein
MDIPSKIISVELADGSFIKIEATPIGEQRVAFQSRPFRDITNSVKAIATELAVTLQEINQTVQPDKVSVKLGLEIVVESGQMTALIVKGAGKANLEIAMEWQK